MPSTYTTRNRWEMQATSEHSNTWGDVLNANGLALIDVSLDGWAAYALSGAKSLTTANGAADEARRRVQHVTGGTGGTITIPSVEKWYIVRNASSGSVILTTGAGDTATIAPGGFEIVICEGTNVYSFGKTYVDQAILDAAISGELPGQESPGYLKTDGTNASWVDVFDDPTLTGDIQLNGSQRGTVSAVAASDVDSSAGNYFTKTVDGATTFTFSNVPAGAYGFTLRITHTSGTITWPASVEFPGDIAPVLTTGKTHVFVFVTDDGGTTWHAAALSDYAA